MHCQYILNQEAGYLGRFVACCADLGEPRALEVVGEGRMLLVTDRGKYFLSHGFEPAWSVQGFLSVEMSGELAGRSLSYFNPRVTAAAIEAGLVGEYGDHCPDWTPRSLQLPDEVRAWNVLRGTLKADSTVIEMVSRELTWVEEDGRPVLPASASSTETEKNVWRRATPFARLAILDNLLWKLFMALGMGWGEQSVADPRECLAARNRIFLENRYAHYLRLMTWHAARQKN